MADKISFLEGFYEGYKSLNETDKKHFSKVVAKLQKETFLIKDKDDDRDDYFFSLEHKEVLINYFAITDFDLLFDSFNSLVYLKTSEDRNRVHLLKFDTALLLILRMLYFRKRKEITFDGKVYVYLSEIVEEVNISKVYEDDRRVSHYGESLRKLRAYKIIDFETTKIDENLSIEIFPSILVVVNSDNLESVITRLNALKREVESEDSIDEASNED